MSDRTALLALAHQLTDDGISSMPMGGPNGKIPKLRDNDRPDLGTVEGRRSWRWRQVEVPDGDHHELDYHRGDITGIAIVCGAVSGNLEMLEFEGEAVDAGTLDDFLIVLEERDPILAKALDATWQDRSPKGGLHYYYRVTGAISGSMKLASRPPSDTELLDAQLHGKKAKIVVLIETRSEGGYSVVSPSARPDHGEDPEVLHDHWEATAGGPEAIVTISSEQRTVLFKVARQFDESESRGKAEARAVAADEENATEEHHHKTGIGPTPLPPRSRARQEGDRPGDIFNREVSWSDVLAGRRAEGERWTLVSTDATTDISYWRKPGSPDPWHATTNANGTDRLIVFSTATEFDGEPHGMPPNIAMTSYSKFEAETVLGGHTDSPPHLTSEDLSRCADMLRREGYTATDASRFISREHGFLAKTFAEAIEQMGWIATDQGHNLWHYRDGLWTQGGDHEIGARSVALLGEKYRPSYRRNTIDWFEQQEPFIDHRPVTQYINCPNGLLDWRTGELIPHDPSVPSINQIPIVWEPDAVCPTVDAWVEEIFPEDCIELAWEVIAYTLYDGNPFHKAVALKGGGRNGKGTYLRLIGGLLGRRNVSAVTVQDLSENRFRPAEVYGKMANLAGDLDARALKRTDVFKMITGEDEIQVERKYGHPFQFTARAVPIFGMNALPRTLDLTEGFFSRWLIIPFVVRLDELPGGFDRTIEDRMAAELPGVFVKAVATLRRLMARGEFTLPESVQAMKREYIEYADPVAAFVKEMVVVDGSGFIPNKNLHIAYTTWARNNGYREMGKNTLIQRIDERLIQKGIEFKSGRKDNVRGLSGITLNVQPEHLGSL
jgi:putative DNA primase/helicase